jgi:coronin-1B/1C/6
MRAYKTVNDSYIEPISFTVPRRAETFQSDIYPPAVGSKPAVSALDWLSGKTALPPKIDLESVYEGNAPVEIASDYKPAPVPKPAAAPAPAPRKEEQPKPAPTAVSRAPPPSTADQKASISAMADKYKADESSSDDDDAETSSFEEIPKPVQRSSIPAAAATQSAKPTPSVQPPTAATPAPSSPVSKSPVAVRSPEAQVQQQPKPTSQAVATTAPAGGSSLESSLETIKQLLEQQTRIISTQSDRIGQLAAEVETLKKKVGNGPVVSQDQSERIRQLELELEAARS